MDDHVKHPAGSLSPREMTLAHCIAQGLSRREAAESMGIRLLTVSGMMKTIYSKLGVHSNAELVRWYADQP